MIQISSNQLIAEQWVPKKISEVFPFFADPKNLEALTPPWLNFRITSQTTPTTELGTLIEYQLRMRGIPMKWKSEITEWIPNERFADNQLIGPYRKWYHVHRFVEKDGGTLLLDTVDFILPMGIFGKIALPLVKRDLTKIFNHRLKVIENLFSKSIEQNL